MVSVFRPRPKLAKLTFQWTLPSFIVVKVNMSTLKVRDLADEGGKKISVVRTTGRPDMIVNRKMTSLYPVPSSFFLGAVVLKKFGGKWCEGKVDWVDSDEGETLWHVSYTDFDEEKLTLTLEEMIQVIAYHPLMDATGDLQIPTPGVLYGLLLINNPGWAVWCQSTRLCVSRPIVVEVFEPQTNAVRLPRSRFVLSRDPDNQEPRVSNITIYQVILRFESLTQRGYLSATDRKKLQTCFVR